MALAEVKRFSSLQEAQIAAGMLRSIGVDAAVCDQHFGAAMPIEQLALGGFRLTAPEEDVQEARVLLQYNARTPEPDDEPLPETSPARTILATVLLLLLGGPMGYLALFGRRGSPSMGEALFGALLALAIFLGMGGAATVLVYARN